MEREARAPSALGAATSTSQAGRHQQIERQFTRTPIYSAVSKRRRSFLGFSLSPSVPPVLQLLLTGPTEIIPATAIIPNTSPNDVVSLNCH